MKVQIVEIEKDNYVRVGFGEQELRCDSFKLAERTLDENGLLLKEIRFTQEGDIEEVTENVYVNGLLTETALKDGDGELIMRTVDEFDAAEHLVKEVKTYGYGSGEEETRMAYEGDCLLREVVCDDEGEHLQKEYAYETLNGRPMVVAATDYDEDGKLQNRYAYEYDGKNQLVRWVRDEVIAKDRRTFAYAYDEAGNRVKELVYNYKEELISKKYFSFDAEKHLTEEVAEDLDHYAKRIFEYAGDLVTKISLLNREGETQSWSQMEYDDRNRLVKMVQYVLDEVNPDQFRLLSEEKRTYRDAETD